MQEILNEELSNKQYDGEETIKWSKHMSELIKEKLKSMLQYFTVWRNMF